MLAVGRSLAVACAIAVLGAAGSAHAEVDATLKKAMKDPANPVVKMATNKGDITIELYKKEAPKTVANFLAYVKKGHYYGHHLPSRHAQLHDPGRRLHGRPEGEAHRSAGRERGRAMVFRTRGHHRHGAHQRSEQRHGAVLHQYVEEQHLPGQGQLPDGAGYCVFGKVIGGMDVVELIKAVKTTQKPPMFEALPVATVEIKMVTQVQ